MSFIQQEFDRISQALREPQNADRYHQLYAAQQALACAMEPKGFASPFDTIERGAVWPSARLDTQATATNCSPECDLHAS
jgi:hypothetical protein